MSRTLALLTFMLVSAVSATPRASEGKEPTLKPAQKVVESALVEPLARKNDRRSKFSRAYRPPTARRVRILDASPKKDARGDAFVTFAIDARHGFSAPDEGELGWRLADITGCVYPGSQTVFIERGNAKFPAALLLGKRVKAAPAHVCKSASGPLAVASSR